MTLSPAVVLNNRYRIVKLLGKGGFGAVYRAWDLHLNKACAVKENLDTTPKAQKQFAREAEILANLHHPNLPRVTDHFLIPGQGQYLVMDYIEGEDMGTTLKRSGGTIPEVRLLPIVKQVNDALSYLHAQNPPIIHRDIKPLNIIITPGGDAVLVDFGIAKIYDSQLSTTLGARAFTPGYSPPEQYGQGGTDARTDVYALGATMYTMLTGHIPIESIQRSTGQELPMPRAINPSITAHTEAVILRAMEITPTRRFNSTHEFWSALQGSGATPAMEAGDEALGAATVQAAGAGWSSSGSYVSAPPAAPGVISPKSGLPPWLKWAGAFVLVGILGLTIVFIGMQLGGSTSDLDPTQSALALLNTEADLTESAALSRPTPSETAMLPTNTPTDNPSPTAPLTPTPTSLPSASPTSALAPLTGDGTVQLTFDEIEYYMPILSADQRRMVTFAKLGDNWQITEIDPNNGGVIRQITKAFSNQHHPHFSADGERILLASDQGSYFNIYVIDSQSGEFIQQLTDSRSTDMTPFWLPDESSFVFMSNRDGDYEIYQGFMDGSPPIKLTDNSSYDGSSSVSPDGRYVVFYSNRSGNPDIYLLELESGREIQLTSSSARDAEPAFSPDGEWIVFESNREGSYDIWAMRLDGSDLHRVTSGAANEQIPAFSPDGIWVLYQSNQSGSYDIFRVPWQ